MKKRIEKFIECHVYHNRTNQCNIPHSHKFTAGSSDELPISGTHYVEASLNDGSDDIEVSYKLTLYDSHKDAIYEFEVVAK